MEWITSGGGPLICLGHSTIKFWRGVDGIGEHKYGEEGFQNDYERACNIQDYLGIIPVQESIGIVLGDMPLDTMIFRRPQELPLIGRVVYSEPDADIECSLSFWTELTHAKEVESVAVSIDEPLWHLFDSAYPGALGLEKCLSVTFPIGEFTIKTFEYKPDPQTFMLIHEFESA